MYEKQALLYGLFLAVELVIFSDRNYRIMAFGNYMDFPIFELASILDIV